MNKWQQFTTLGWYDGLIEFVFRFVAKTSEPLLAAGLVISAADFLTSGALMRNNAAFSMAWAWTQAIAIEASSGVVFVYALQSFRQQDKVKAWLYLVLSILLALTGGAMLLFQLIANTTGMQERTLPGGLFYGLAVLRVLVSVSYVYLCRAKTIRFTDLADVSEPQVEQAVQPAPVPTLDLAALLDQLDERYSQRMQAIVEQVVTRVQVHVTQEVPLPPALPALTQTSTENDQPIYEDEEDEAQPIYLDRFASKEHAIAALLAQKPGATPEEIAQEVGCNVRTVEKWLKKLVAQKGGMFTGDSTQPKSREN
jgi:hypothetical protein